MGLAACYQGLLSLAAAPGGAEVRGEWAGASAISHPAGIKHCRSEEGPYVSGHYSIKNCSFLENDRLREAVTVVSWKISLSSARSASGGGDTHHMLGC